MHIRPYARALVAAALAVLTVQAPADAARPRPDRAPPTVPADFRVTAVTQTSVSFAWSPSTDDVGVRSYSLWGDGLGGVVGVPHPTTTGTVTGLRPGQTVDFRVAAYDGVDVSGYAGPLTVTTLADTVAPSTPTGLAVLAVDGAKVQLRWNAATDDVGPVRYRVVVDGVVTPNAVSTIAPGTFPVPPSAGAWVRQLDPGPHQFAVQAVDGAGNASAVTGAVGATVAPDADTTAPTTPTLLSLSGGGTSFCPEELWIRWTASTDDVTPATGIEYEVRVNGVINEVATGATRTVAYTDVRGANTVTIVAVDRAGNASAPSNALTERVDWGSGCGT
jgi:hypothetical protein